MNSFFSSPFWRDVERALERAPQFLRGGGISRVVEPNVTARLLRSRLDCIRQACDQADHEALTRLRTQLAGLAIEDVLHGLLDALKEVVLIVGASVGVSAAAGAGIGAFVGGIGAAPGAAIGAALGTQVGVWILGALGLKALAEFFIEGLPHILQSYYRGFSAAWQAGHDDISEGRLSHSTSLSISSASSDIADGHVAMVMLLLSAVVAYLTRGRGDMQVLAQQARSGRLGERFAIWLVKNETKLREHPNLQHRQQRPSGSAGGDEPPPPRPPRREGDEPRRPGRMPRKPVRCFETNGLSRFKVPEFDRQLKGQENGLNDMSVDEYLKGRRAFDEGEVTRNRQIARAARVDYEEKVTTELEDKLRGEGLSRNDAKTKATKMAADKMKTLAALHNPDMATGGKDVISDFGDRNVNSRIGAQWKAGKPSRLDGLDEAARSVPERDRAITRMNAQLERCK